MIAKDCLPQGGVWTYPPKDLKLNRNEVHVWCALYSDLKPNVADMIPLLSKDERLRADKYHLTKDQQNFILRHGLLRQILAHYLRIDPDQLVFQKNKYGKPFLKSNSRENSLFLSMTHSTDLALYAFSPNLEIGIDVENVHAFPDIDSIVNRFFSPPESSEFASLPEEKRLRAFFRGWTCKEAVLKAIGKGLSDGLDDFCVTLDPDKKAGVRDMDSQFIKAKDWFLDIFEPIPEYISAVAVKSRDQQYELKYLKWT